MKSTLEISVGLPVPTYTRASLIRVPCFVESALQKKRRRRFSRRYNRRRWAIIKRFTILETRGGTKCNLNKIYDREPMIDKGQCPFHRDAEGCEIERERREARGPNERGTLRLSARVDKEAPSMQIKCCFHNHSSVPLSEVRFFVIKVKGTFTRGRVRSFAPTNQPANQPTNHPSTPTHTHPSTNYPLISITESFKTFLCVILIKRSIFFSRQS